MSLPSVLHVCHPHFDVSSSPPLTSERRSPQMRKTAVGKGPRPIPGHNPCRNSESRNSWDTTTSMSTSQDSLQSSDCPTSENTTHTTNFHRYYHVFREHELDRLIEKYVENLHIISSYYDHANWCIVAEKVQVWTI
jgi:hypothetical protein